MISQDTSISAPCGEFTPTEFYKEFCAKESLHVHDVVADVVIRPNDAACVDVTIKVDHIYAGILGITTELVDATSSVVNVAGRYPYSAPWTSNSEFIGYLIEEQPGKTQAGNYQHLKGSERPLITDEGIIYWGDEDALLVPHHRPLLTVEICVPAGFPIKLEQVYGNITIGDIMSDVEIYNNFARPLPFSIKCGAIKSLKASLNHGEGARRGANAEFKSIKTTADLILANANAEIGKDQTHESAREIFDDLRAKLASDSALNCWQDVEHASLDVDATSLAYLSGARAWSHTGDGSNDRITVKDWGRPRNMREGSE